LVPLAALLRGCLAAAQVLRAVCWDLKRQRLRLLMHQGTLLAGHWLVALQHLHLFTKVR
jgi:hypothetical protein